MYYQAAVPFMKNNILFLPPLQGSPTFFVNQKILGGQHIMLPNEGLKQGAKQLLRDISAERFAIVGLSYGGLLGWHMALQDPSRVSCLITLGVCPSLDLLSKLFLLRLGFAKRLPNPIFSIFYAKKVQALLEGEGIKEDHIRPIVNSLPSRRIWSQRISSIFEEFPLAPSPVPHLFLQGNSDVFATWTLSEVSMILPTAKVETIPGGHYANYTHPDKFNLAVVDFLSIVNSKTGFIHV